MSILYRSLQILWHNFRSFAYMMVLTGQPQYISVHNQSGSHALVVYGISQGKLKVSDPNWPTQKDREIVF
ncbi:MAG: hypothetical protein IPN15_12790 [Saprospiraceae bacterium]|nr:hypothetical protein [Candidatus Vicinibacter affinis]